MSGIIPIQVVVAQVKMRATHLLNVVPAFIPRVRVSLVSEHRHEGCGKKEPVGSRLLTLLSCEIGGVGRHILVLIHL